MRPRQEGTKIEEFIPRNRDHWRKWLQKNHAKVTEVLLVYFKKDSGKANITYIESLEEALCFGWIDGIRKRRDEESYTHRFTPRKEKSKWSPTNLKLAKLLITEKKMTPAGQKAYESRLEYSRKVMDKIQAKSLSTPAELSKALLRNKCAASYFDSLAPSHRKQYILWISTAKKVETREKRIKEAIKLLSDKKKLGMK